MFKAFDLNNDGQLDRKEVFQMFDMLYYMLYNEKITDANKDILALLLEDIGMTNKEQTFDYPAFADIARAHPIIVSWLALVATCSPFDE